MDEGTQQVASVAILRKLPFSMCDCMGVPVCVFWPFL